MRAGEGMGGLDCEVGRGGKGGSEDERIEETLTKLGLDMINTAVPLPGPLPGYDFR
jgi:hypothetical protein